MGYPAGIKIADWARAEERKKARADKKGNVRSTFAFLFGAAVLVYVYSDHTAFQNYLYSKLGPVLAGSTDSSSFKISAMKHENEVNQIAH